MYNKKFWDNIYKNIIVKKPSYDLWLNRYINILEKYRDEEIINSLLECKLYLCE
jgi:hypothetical protein